MPTSAETTDDLERLYVLPTQEHASVEPTYEEIRASIHETRDVRLAPEGHYLNYWQNLLERNAKTLHANPDTRHTIEATQRRVLRLDERISDTRTGRCYAEEAAEWYHSLGSLNTMEGSVEALLQAASIMEKTAESTHGKPKHDLLAANMLHEAALLSPLDIRFWFYQAALDHYDSVIESTAPISTREIAERHKYDLLFAALFDTASNEQDGLLQEWDEEHREQFRKLLREQTDLFDTNLKRDYVRYKREEAKLEKMRGKERREQRKLLRGLRGTVAGKAFEWFALLGLRYWQVRNDRYHLRTVRSSFAREQEVHLSYYSKDRHADSARKDKANTPKMNPKHSIDAVVYRHAGRGETAVEHWQLKTGSIKGMRYLKEIVPLEARVSADRRDVPFKEKRFEYDDFDRFVGLMGEAARIFSRHCQGKELTSDEKQLAAVALQYVRPPRAA